MSSIPQRIAEELSVKQSQVEAAVNLLDEGATVPFVARYRKEVTGGLDDIQLLHLDTGLKPAPPENYPPGISCSRRIRCSSSR